MSVFEKLLKIWLRRLLSRKDDGIGLMEALIALAVVSTVMFAILKMTVNALQLAKRNELEDVSIQLLVEGIEYLEGAADFSVDVTPSSDISYRMVKSGDAEYSLNSVASGGAASCSEGSGFRINLVDEGWDPEFENVVVCREVVIEDVAASNFDKITLIVGWQDVGGDYRWESLDTYRDLSDIVDIDEPQPPQSDCGDGRREGDEQCDGGDLAGQTCELLGFAGGVLQCSITCTFDTTNCEEETPGEVPPETCGTGGCEYWEGETCNNCLSDCGIQWIEVSPSYIWLRSGQQQEFTVTARDMYWNECQGVDVDWSIWGIPYPETCWGTLSSTTGQSVIYTAPTLPCDRYNLIDIYIWAKKGVYQTAVPVFVQL